MGQLQTDLEISCLLHIGFNLCTQNVEKLNAALILLLICVFDMNLNFKSGPVAINRASLY